MNTTIKLDCKHFNGYKPCKYHKVDRRSCVNCKDYIATKHRILIVKLEAAGEVLRSTPVMATIRKKYPKSEITLITKYPQLIRRSLVDKIMNFDFQSYMAIQSEEFDLVFSLDKSREACGFAQQVKSKAIKGFLLSPFGKIMPADKDAYDKWLRGVDDGLMLQNKVHYVAEMFEVCGYSWNGEEYILPDFSSNPTISMPNSFTVGIQTGAGAAWKTRIPSDKFINAIIDKIKTIGDINILLLGGPDEDARNKSLATNKNVFYFGTYDYAQFFSIVNICDVVITPVTLALHIAVGLKKKIVLLNNIFNKYEFYLYGNGIIVEPDIDCVGCYKNHFDDTCPVSDCTELYNTDFISTTVQKWLNS